VAAVATGYGEIALALLDKGWPSIPTNGKLPAKISAKRRLRWGKFQRRYPTRAEVETFARRWPDAGTAIPGGVAGVVFLDLDTDDAQQAATYSEIAADVFGPSPIVRIGRWPRSLRLYQADDIPSQDGPSWQLLSYGRYAVMFGVHPTTLEPYTYNGPSPLDIAPADLPWITLAKLDSFRREIDALAPVDTKTHAFQVRTGPPVRPAITAPAGRLGTSYTDALAGVPRGGRHIAMKVIAFSNRARCVPLEEAEREALEAAARCIPPRDPTKAQNAVRWVYRCVAPGTNRDVLGDLTLAHRAALAEIPADVPRGQRLYRLFLGMLHALATQHDRPYLAQAAFAVVLGCTRQHVGRMATRARAEGVISTAGGYVCPSMADKDNPSRSRGYTYRGTIKGRANPRLTLQDEKCSLVSDCGGEGLLGGVGEVGGVDSGILQGHGPRSGPMAVVSSEMNATHGSFLAEPVEKSAARPTVDYKQPRSGPEWRARIRAQAAAILAESEIRMGADSMTLPLAAKPASVSAPASLPHLGVVRLPRAGQSTPAPGSRVGKDSTT